ncbi:MAG: ATP-grasp domain-containing protein [Actinomycetota bacterium]|nr:ATP-grasp domain-containing protein [Actinomycetota bacterium]
MADPPDGYDQLNEYSRIIVDEALRRDIAVELLDAGLGELVLTRDGRRVTTIQSLSELTSAVAFRRCHDKLHTRRVLERAGLRLPAGREATFDDADAAFLEECKELVVKPTRGEGGEGVTVGVVDPDDLDSALDAAKAVWPHVVLEQRCQGEDLRVIVIDGQVVAAAVRRPPAVTGDGRRTVGELIEELSRTRAAKTDGASVPLDDATLQVVRAAGYDVDSVLPAGETLAVRGAANVHTGGTIDDVTDALHDDLVAVAVAAAEAIGIPVLGLDLIVPAIDGPEYLIIEANEQPGLANHEPQPTAERFLDLLFPESAGTASTD